MSNFDLGGLTKALVTCAVAFRQAQERRDLFFARLASEIEVKTDSLNAALGVGVLTAHLERAEATTRFPPGEPRLPWTGNL